MFFDTSGHVNYSAMQISQLELCKVDVHRRFCMWLKCMTENGAFYSIAWIICSLPFISITKQLYWPNLQLQNSIFCQLSTLKMALTFHTKHMKPTHPNQPVAAWLSINKTGTQLPPTLYSTDQDEKPVPLHLIFLLIFYVCM